MDGNVLRGIRQEEGARAPVLLPSFCTGFGQADTHSPEINGRDGKPRQNGHPSAGTDYQTIKLTDVFDLAGSPLRVDKGEAQWIIPSVYAKADARAHSVQRKQGAFWLLPLDVDSGNLSLEDVDSALVSICGDVKRVIYSTRSARPDERKWRALVALSAPIAGADYSDAIKAFNELLAEISRGRLVADRALCRPGQLIYLPNRGEFYENKIETNKPAFDLTDKHPISTRRERIRLETAEIERQVAEDQAVRKARAGSSEAAGIVDTFNAGHEIADLFIRYGYEPECEMGGRDWRSPYQESGSFATRDYGSHWISLSGSDAAKGLGKEAASGVRSGDAFDLYVHFTHAGDFTAAVRAYAAEVGQDHVTQRNNVDPSDYFEALPPSQSDSTAQRKEQGPRLLPFMSFEAASNAALTESARPLVKGLLDEGAFSVFYGPSNSGKTFVVLDLAYSISLGRDWGGMKTTKSSVLYIATEGGGGIKKRIAALRQRRDGESPTDFYMSAATIDLRRPDGDVTAIIDTARSIGHVGLIVIDTLSRALAGGDETKDMGALVVSIDKIRQTTGAHILLVHHSGKDVTKGARGSSELRGAIDTEINIDGGTIRVTKQRDLEFGETIGFEIQSTPIGLDADGEVVTSATVNLKAANSGKPKAPTATELEVFDTVCDLLGRQGEGALITAPMVAEQYKTKEKRMAPDAARKHLQSLANKHFLRFEGQGRWALTPVKLPENRQKSGNSKGEKTTGAIPAYVFATEHLEIEVENGVFK
tara:strand:- start:2856 stop:5144 length:2289 start_codon:yes stop_codon:yes gene_type:complete